MDFQYELLRSKRKTLSVEIKEHGRIVVRAPKTLPQRDIDAFLISKSDWIKKHVELRQEKEKPGQDALVFSKEDLKLLVEEAKIYFPVKVKLYAALMGVSYGSITIRHQKTRWGSCSSKGNLNFNCLLMAMPEDIRDYVIIHELGHRKQMNHSAAFWAEVEKLCPDYRLKRKWLKEEGRRYMVQESNEPSDRHYFAYIVKCGDGTFYTGYTNDLDNRIKMHNLGLGAKYTKSRRPVELVYYEECDTKEAAMRRESNIKLLSRSEKQELMNRFLPYHL